MIDDENEIYNTTIIAAEDFSNFTKGTEDNPDPDFLDGYISDELTQTPGWSAYYVQQAGGCAKITRSANNTATLSSPILDIPANGKPVVVTFRARMTNPEFNFDWAEVYMVDCTDMSNPLTFSNDYAYTYNEWHEYKFVFNKNRKNTKYFFQFGGYDTDMLVDDIQIKFLDPKVEAPVATGYSDFSCTGFTTTWEAVPSADAYLVNLFTIAEDKDKTRTYIINNARTSGTSYTFSNIDTSNSVLYFSVRALKGNDKSPESNFLTIYGLETPTTPVMAKPADGKIKVTWQAVPGAQYYEILAERSHTATADETFVLSEENFDKLISDGSYTKPEQLTSINEELDLFTNQPGWIAQNPVHINGAYGLIGYYYQQYGELAFLESPIFDLSANNGTVTLSVDLYGQPINQLDECKAVLRMMNYTSETQITSADKFTTPELPEKWSNYTVDLKNGSAKSVVEICATAGYIYVDNITISQQLSSGDKVSVPYLNLNSDKNEIELPVFDYAADCDLSIKVRAVREIWDAGGFAVNEYVRSEFSDAATVSIDSSSAIDDIENNTDSCKAFVNDGQLVIINPLCADVEIFDSTGRKIHADTSGSTLICKELPTKGIYIIRVDTAIIKVAN